MRVDNNIAALYQPGLYPSGEQAQPRASEQDRQQTLDSIQASRRMAPRLSAAEREGLRTRYEQQQQTQVSRDGLSSYARNALDVYDTVSRVENRNYMSQVLGIDLYA